MHGIVGIFHSSNDPFLKADFQIQKNTDNFVYCMWIKIEKICVQKSISISIDNGRGTSSFARIALHTLLFADKTKTKQKQIRKNSALRRNVWDDSQLQLCPMIGSESENGGPHLSQLQCPQLEQPLNYCQ